MKRERLILTVLAAVFGVELAIGIPAFYREYKGDDAAPEVRAPVRPLAVAGSVAQPRLTPLPRKPAVASSGTFIPVPIRRPDLQRDTSPKRVALAPIVRERVAVIDDVPDGRAAASFAYTGHWEHVRALDDGRTGGTSSRSFAPGSLATLSFVGAEVRMYGVCGPHGGRATVFLDGHRTASTTSFYAAAKETHMLVYRSPRLARGTHRLLIFVVPETTGAKRYVNIDGAEYD